MQNRPTIGVLIGWRVSWNPEPYSYLGSIFKGINAAVRDAGCNLLLSCGMDTQTHQAKSRLPAWPIFANDQDFVPVGPWNTDGLIVLNPVAHNRAAAKYIHEVCEARHPIVFIAKGEEARATIVADNEGGIFQAISHLVKHGHQRIAFLAGSPDDMNGDGGDRIRGYLAAVQQLKVDADPALFLYAHHTFNGGYLAAQQLLTSQVSFTAILASNDEVAKGAMKAIKEAGLRIPQDVAMIGFDDGPEAMAQQPPLTSVHVPLYSIGYQAVDVLLKQIAQQEHFNQTFKVSTTLTIRQSCGCRPDSLLNIATPATAISVDDFAAYKSSIVDSMAKAVMAETRIYTPDEIQILCARLMDAFILSVEETDPTHFQQWLASLLRRVSDDDDDADIWQSVISILRHQSSTLIAAIQRPSTDRFVLDLLDGARSTISKRMRQQRGETSYYERWLTNKIGALTAHLMLTSDMAQIHQVLEENFPSMGIQHASLSFFEAEGADPIAWSTLHAIPDTTKNALLRFPTRQFPPKGLHPTDAPFSLLLLPLYGPAGQVGFIAYDSINIEFAGLITQQIEAALNNVRLHLEASAGRKLAEEANSLKSRFLSMVSHELRTPLNLIVGLSDMILQNQAQGELVLPIPYRKDIEQIYSSAQHLGRLIRDVLDLASSQVGKLRLTNELLDLGETLEMVAATGRQMAAEKGLGWQDEIPSIKLPVWGDRTRLRQVALNLVSNAIKFTAHGDVRLRVEVLDGKAWVRVSDTGLGIAPQEQRQIFDEFRRSEQAQGYAGLGLGLAIAKRLMEMHGGEIGVESTGQAGAGSTFYFSLPLVEPETIYNEAHLLPFDADAFVLLLTNTLGSGEQLRDHLIQKGIEVKMLQIDQHNETDDWLLPVMNMLPGAIVLDMAIVPVQGWHVLKTIKENPATQTIPLLFYSLAQDKGAMLELNYLTKPVVTAELARVLEYHKLNAEDGKTEKVFLIVDDDPATLEMHVRIVESQLGKHQILRACNGREALQVMQQHTPDLVLLDLSMPELDGFGVLEAMREKDGTRNIPVIVLTGQVLSEKEMARLNQGVTMVLEKGLFSVEETLSHIDTALARKRRLGSAAKRLIRQAITYIHAHYAEEITREQLAAQLRISNDYLSLCFRSELGVTFIVYLNRYRVNQAKLLLAESDMNIMQIAMAVGFSDSGYFSRVFKQQVGISPDSYRRK